MSDEVFITKEALDGLGAKLGSLKPISTPVIDIIRQHYKKIVTAKDRGVTNAQIIDVLKDEKVKITSAKLDQYLNQIANELMSKRAGHTVEEGQAPAGAAT